MTSDHQDYSPFRQTILAREDLRQLATLRPGVAVRDMIVDWSVILLAWTAVALVPAWWSVLIAIPVIGTRYYALLIIGHDGLHRRLAPSAAMNDLLSDVFILGAIGAVTRINRENHMTHHQITALPDDPDRHKYVHDDKEPTIPFLLFVAGLSSFRRTIANVFFKRGRRPAVAGDAPGLSQYRAADVALLLGWQLCLIGGLTLAIGWWAYPVLWILPVYLFAYRGDLVRVFCEHSMLTSDASADADRRMISYDVGWFERQFFAPHNMNNHISHHLWPHIPYYNLPATEARVRAWAHEHDHARVMRWRPSYTGYMLSYLRWRLGAGASTASTGVSAA